MNVKKVLTWFAITFFVFAFYSGQVFMTILEEHVASDARSVLDLIRDGQFLVAGLGLFFFLLWRRDAKELEKTRKAKANTPNLN